MNFSIPYGKTTLSFTLPDSADVTVVAPRDVPPAEDPSALVRQALDSPLGGFRFEERHSAKTAAIAINDKTRPVPHSDLLPPLLERLEQTGIPAAGITLMIATGAHPPMASEEFPQVVPADILARYPVICHDCDDRANLLHLGHTQRGTPVWINRVFYEADLRIVVGNIEPHQFQGFSGGVKSAAIGLAGRETINHNHAMMLDPMSGLGEYHANPARQDVEDIGRAIEVHMALNAVLNAGKRIVHAIAGEP
jgi:nickel-dependent lactate racemase